MVLSKDAVDDKEEIKVLELTSSQKRKLRRKKLKAARARTLDIDISTQVDIPDKNKYPNKSVASHQGQVSNKQERHKYDQLLDNGIQTSEETSIISNQKTKCAKAASPTFDLKSTSQSANSIKISKTAPKDTEKQDHKGQQHDHLIPKENKLEKPLSNINVNPELGNLNSKKKQKAKLNGNYQGNPKNTCVIENKINKSDNSNFCSNQIAVNLKPNDKPASIPHSLLNNENQSSKLKDLNESKTDSPDDKDHVLIKEQTIGLFKSDSHSTNLENTKLENQEPKPLKPEPVENLASTLDKPNMGKIQDTPGSQKQQEGLNKVEAKQEDASSTDMSAKSREEIKAAREAKKLAKLKAKKKDDNVGESAEVKTVAAKADVKVKENVNVKDSVAKTQDVASNQSEKTKAEPISDLKSKENIPPTKVEDKPIKKLDEDSKDNKSETTTEKAEDGGKSKAELKAERRARQEAQRAAKQQAQRAAAKQAAETKPAPDAKKEPAKPKEEKALKPKSAEKAKSKTQSVQKVGWFQHLYIEKDKESLNSIPINSNIHPAVVKLGVRLAERVVTGSNARCIALLDAIKKMVRDYSLPARTELGRGLQAQLAAAAAHLAARRVPAAAETNALKHVRRQLTLLPANVDEFDAKKQLQEEIDRYIREQIDMAGEAISLILRNKISPGDHILTYGCSSLIERVLCSAWAAGVQFRATVAGARGQRGREMLRRLRARGVPAAYVDISALSYIMADVQKVVLGAGALLAHGAALGAAGSATAALVARARNVPVLVACETHKFSERTHLDTLVTCEIGDPDDLIDHTDPHSPLKEWRSNPHLSLLNVTHDVTPPGLITAVVTELGILPCTSAPVVLRFKLAEYGM